MEIKRIIVDELPESCYNCRFPEAFHYATEWKCTITGKYMGDCDKRRHKDCPLDVEKECIWLGEYYGYDENGDMIFVSKKTGCSDVHIQAVKVPDNTFCPNCGKRIRYEEE